MIKVNLFGNVATFGSSFKLNFGGDISKLDYNVSTYHHTTGKMSWFYILKLSVFNVGIYGGICYVVNDTVYAFILNVSQYFYILNKFFKSKAICYLTIRQIHVSYLYSHYPATEFFILYFVSLSFGG